MKAPPRRQPPPPPPPAAPRAQSPSAFSPFLEALQRGCPGCRSVAFVDREGEAVDYVGSGEEFDIKVAGAHWRILLHEAGALPGGALRRLVIVSAVRSYVVEQLPEGYALILVYPPSAAFGISERALSACSRALCSEAGFPPSRPAHTWAPIDVYPRHPRGRRPEWAYVDDTWQSVEVLGLLMGLRPRERGYRVRLGGGAEITLVREPLGRWWAGEERG